MKFNLESIIKKTIVTMSLVGISLFGGVKKADAVTFIKEPISTAPSYQDKPDIWNNRIVWQDKRFGNWDIYVYDIDTKTENSLIGNPSNQEFPSIHKNKVVFQDDRNGNSEIYLYDFDVGFETRLTNNPSNQTFPFIWENKVVYEDDINGNQDIYIYDLISGIETRLTTNTSDQKTPKIFGSRVIWEDRRVSSWDIGMYDLITGTEMILSRAGYQMQQSISNDKIVFIDALIDADVKLLNLITGEERILNDDFPPIWYNYPDIQGDKVVYMETGFDYIMMHDLNTGINDVVEQVTGPNRQLFYPVVHRDKIVWEENYPDDSNTDIYMATIIDEQIPLSPLVPLGVALGVGGLGALVLGYRRRED